VSVQNTISYVAAPVIVATEFVVTLPVVLQSVMYIVAIIWYGVQIYGWYLKRKGK
jgi:predicted membrane channel-forming protein YqfA (hemolysin III family)